MTEQNDDKTGLIDEILSHARDLTPHEDAVRQAMSNIEQRFAAQSSSSASITHALPPRPDVQTELADGVSRGIHPPRRFVAMFQSKRVPWSVAAAAAISMAVAFWPSSHRSVAFAEVLQQMQQASTVTYRTVSKQTGSPDFITITRNTVDIAAGNRSRSEILKSSDEPAEDDTVIETVQSITVYNGGRILILNPKEMTAEFIDYVTDGLPHRLDTSHTLADLLNLNPANAEPLGEQVIDGVELVGFRVNRDYDKFNKRSVVVWADPQTLLPVRVEDMATRREPDNAALAALSAKESEDGAITLSPEEADEVMAKWPEVTTTRLITDIVFNVPVDDSMFSLDPPPGYTLSVTTVP